nr:TraM recognition domain-containing protein [Tissierella carlieri]
MYGLLGKSENELDDDDLININDYNKNILEERQEDINIQLKPKLKDLTYKVRVFSKGTGRLVLRNLGLTVVAPDGEFTSQVVEIGKEYGIKIHKIDPFMDEILRGNVAKFNPLKGDSPEKIGDIVASILVSMDIGPNSKTNPYFTNAGVRAIRNLVILLKISFPPLYNREPTLEDVLACLNNFDLVEEPVKYVEDNPSLLRRWKSIVDYFKTRFLDPPKDHDGKNTNSRVGSLKYNTQQAVEGMVNQLDNLLSREEIRYILCNEDESIDLAQILRKGECIAISTRQGNLGERLGRAFALFFILSLQNEVLNRYAENENPEIPHFIQIDEFPMYCNESTETFFSFSRKYKCSVTIAIQDMAQLKRISDEFGQTIFTNTTIKLLLPKSNIEDRKYWSEFFGSTKEMELTTGISTNSLFADNPSYNETLRGSLTETKNVSEEDIDNLNFQQLYYSYVDKKGRKVFGKGITDFMEVKRKPYMEEVFDFEPYAISEEDYNKTLVEKNEVMNKRKRLEKTDKLKKQAYNSSDQLFIDKEEKELNIVGESLFIDNSSTPPLLSAKNNKTVDLVLMEEVSIDQNKGIIFDTQEDNDKTKDLILSDEDSKYINEAPSYIVEDKENDKAKEKHDKNINIEFLIFEDDERSI